MRFKLKIIKTAATAFLSLLALAATAGGIVSGDLVASISIAIAAAALAAAYLSYRQSTNLRRQAQQYFAQIEAAARRLEQTRMERQPVRPGQAAVNLNVKTSNATGGAAEFAPQEPPGGRLTGVRPKVIEGGKGKPEHGRSDAAAAEDALLLALDNHDLPVSLEPVVELRSSTVAAYRAHATLAAADGASVNIRRLTGKHAGIDPTRFDMELFHAAASVCRRFQDTVTETTPILCPLGPDTLASAKDLRKIIAMATSLAQVKSVLVFDLPAAAFAREGVMATGATLLMEAGLRIAVEGGMKREEAKNAADRFEFDFWSMKAADILLDGPPQMPNRGNSAKAAQVIALDLHEDHEVVAMIDAGVTLVCGPRFSEPKAVKPRGSELSAADAPERVTRLI